VELGSGTGLVGLAAAASGAHVLLTDVPVTLSGATSVSLAYNVANGGAAADGSDVDGAGDAPKSSAPWVGAVCLGRGTAAVAPLDWTKPLKSQGGGQDLSSTEVVLACETCFLSELLEPFMQTLAGLSAGPQSPTAFIAYVERVDGESPMSGVFTTRHDVECAFNAHGLAYSVFHEGPLERHGWSSSSQVELTHRVVVFEVRTAPVLRALAPPQMQPVAPSA